MYPSKSKHLEISKKETYNPNSIVSILSVLWTQGGNVMKQFYEWLHNIGYSDNELMKLPANHLEALQQEYLMLLYGED